MKTAEEELQELRALNFINATDRTSGVLCQADDFVAFANQEVKLALEQERREVAARERNHSMFH